ncbi:MAG: protein tyrosine phosphatase family protein [Pseudomonadota bacterium]
MAKHGNTLRTLMGFLRSVLARWIPALSKATSLSDIYNYLPIEGVYSTSGQPSESQLRLIKTAGFRRVINLAPTSRLENSVVEEARILEDLGIAYTHIPVDFAAPQEADFNAFVAALEEDGPVWVHCAANMRVSAFTYRYRTRICGEDEGAAMADLQKIWNPVGVWADFILRD